MITLYTNFNAVCGQKIEFLLNHSALDYNKIDVNLRNGEQHQSVFLKLNPAAQVPVLLDDDKIVLESNEICRYLDTYLLDEHYSQCDPVLLNQWLDQVHTAIHPACSVISWSLAIRPAMLNKTLEALKQHFANIPDAERRKRQQRAFELGLELPELHQAIATYQHFVCSMRDQLSITPWLAGDQISLADFCVIPYLIRLEHLSFNSIIDRFPEVCNWLSQIKLERGFEQVFILNYPSGFIQQWQQYGLQAKL
ncbi:glutathione S-transferase family protein [Aliikangiella maris]|uniref:Glutathione S-transferase family protein n=2 Tax=Aliikangiella maris TaxID=3162458 RepID=A0ABV2BXY4_9GAMM